MTLTHDTTNTSSSTGPRHIAVSCAIVEHNGTILCAQRPTTTSLPLKWEFPGGKIEAGETAEECLHRELMEELGVTVQVTASLTPSTFHYPDFTVTLHPFICHLSGALPTCHEHESLLWLPSGEMHTLDWAEADLPVIADYLSRFATSEPL